MDAKHAIAIAKKHLSEMFSDEMTAPPTLEEIWLDEVNDEWCVTLGVRRPTDHVERDLWRDPLGAKLRTIPDYKVVRVSNKPDRLPVVVNREAVRA
jgi:hypothetical protein